MFLGVLLSGCTREDPRAITPRHALRADVLGCWRLGLAQIGDGIASPPTAPSLIQLDSLPVSASGGDGRRVVRRLTADGVPLDRDADGLPLHDAWAVDSTGDRLMITFDNGRAGSTWLLDFARDPFGVSGMHGFSRAVSEGHALANAPWLAVSASRVMCAAPR